MRRSSAVRRRRPPRAPSARPAASGRRSHSSGLEAARPRGASGRAEARVVAVGEVDGREVVGPQLGGLAVGRAALVAVGERRLVAVVAVDDRQRPAADDVASRARSGSSSHTRQSRCVVPSSSVVSSSGTRSATSALERLADAPRRVVVGHEDRREVGAHGAQHGAGGRPSGPSSVRSWRPHAAGRVGLEAQRGDQARARGGARRRGRASPARASTCRAAARARRPARAARPRACRRPRAPRRAPAGSGARRCRGCARAAGGADPRR